MSIQKSEAILLSKRDIRETSNIVVFYTEGYGKVKGLVKGVRGPQAKFGLWLHEFAKFDIVYYERRKADTYIITQCDLKDPYVEIAEDLYKRLAAYHILELVDKFAPLADKSPDIYQLLSWILETIRKEKYIEVSLIIFQLKLLQYSGLLPRLDDCVHCSKKILQNSYFSIRLSGLLCSSCNESDIQAMPLSKGAIASIQMIGRQAIRQLSRSTITKGISREIKRLLERFIAYHLGENLRTQEFMKELAATGVL